MIHNSSAEREAELMVDILDFARCHGRKILNTHMTDFGGEEVKPAFQKLLIGEYLKKVEKKDSQAFYTLTSKGLNLFEEKRRSQSISEELKTRIIEKLQKAMSELEIKPWEVMFHIIYVIGRTRTVTTQDILEYYFWIVRPFIQLKNVHHPLYVYLGQFWNAPHLFFSMVSDRVFSKGYESVPLRFHRQSLV